MGTKKVEKQKPQGLYWREYGTPQGVYGRINGFTRSLMPNGEKSEKICIKNYSCVKKDSMRWSCGQRNQQSQINNKRFVTIMRIYKKRFCVESRGKADTGEISARK